MKCYHLNEVCTSAQHRSGKRGPPCMDVNTRVALGCLQAGMGHTHVNHLLSTLNVPTISHKGYKVREREVGRCVEAVTQESCKRVICKEKENNSENKKAGWWKWLLHMIWVGRREEKGTIHQLGMVQ